MPQSHHHATVSSSCHSLILPQSHIATVLSCHSLIVPQASVRPDMNTLSFSTSVLACAAARIAVLYCPCSQLRELRRRWQLRAAQGSGAAAQQLQPVGPHQEHLHCAQKDDCICEVRDVLCACAPLAAALGSLSGVCACWDVFTLCPCKHTSIECIFLLWVCRPAFVCAQRVQSSYTCAGMSGAAVLNLQRRPCTSRSFWVQPRCVLVELQRKQSRCWLLRLYIYIYFTLQICVLMSVCARARAPQN